jgi:hypothetical protein
MNQAWWVTLTFLEFDCLQNLSRIIREEGDANICIMFSMFV